MDFSQALHFLNSLSNFEYNPQVSTQNFDLTRVSRLLKVLGQPQKNLRFIHVVGTKGKGSTCAFVAAILKEAGFKTGLYTSPHFWDVRERIRILRHSEPRRGEESHLKDSSAFGLRMTSQKDFEGKISSQEFTLLISKIKPVIERLGKNQFTYFEVLTVLAIEYFAREQVDFVVWETGLGGRLDATNAVDSLVCAVTPISFDHTAFLGNMLKKIAGEKAAIIKNKSQRVVISQQPKEAREVILKRCQQFSIKPLVVGRDIFYKICSQNINCQQLNVRIPPPFRGRQGGGNNSSNNYPPLAPPLKGGEFIFNVKTSLLGEHQAENVATAVGVVESLRCLGFKISERSIRRGILNMRWPGRFEILSKNPLVIADAAHNVASAEALVKTIRKLLPRRKVTLILGVSKDKDIPGICRVLNTIADSVIATQSEHPRAHLFDAKTVQRFFPGKEIQLTRNVKEAFEQAKVKKIKNQLILATGSIFTVAEIKKCTNSKD